MKQIGAVPFPETIEELRTWRALTYYHALDRRVIAVAQARREGTWAAYIGAVPGIDHEDEMWVVLKEGSKLPEILARPMFLLFDKVPYAE